MAVRHNFDLAGAGEFLAWLSAHRDGPVSLDDIAGLDPFALVALTTLARHEMEPHLEITAGGGDVARFAHAVGMREAIEGRRSTATEPARTVTLARFGKGTVDDEPLVRAVAKLIAGGSVTSATFKGVRYVLVELLRNVNQHSGDPLGGVLMAQVLDRAGVSRRVQVAVADAGRGVFEHLRRMHPSLPDVQTALERSLHPHFSGAFAEGQTGTEENAGLGLFVISELSKMTGGSFLLASRGDALLIRDLPQARQRAVFLDSGGFPGTLVAFECVLASLDDFETLFRAIIDKADAQRPTRVTAGVVKFDSAGADPAAARFLIGVASEDTARAVEFATKTLVPRLTARQPVVLDFQNWTVFTQSYLHALLYVPIRVAWATRTPIYVENALPVVRSAIEWVESYALVG